MSTWQVGDVRVDRILECERPLLPPGQLFPTSTREAIDRHRHWLEPALLDPASQFLVIAFHSFLIRSRGLNILVDTCGGNDKPRPQKQRYHLRRWPYLETLARAGMTPEDIDFVLCTHLHVDHVGWNTRLVDGRWVPTFPRARYLFARSEWEYWREHYTTEAFTDDPYHLDSILPVIEAGQAQFVESDHAFNQEVWLDPTPGHTPGHVGVHVRSRGQECVMSGDLMHHALQCAEPDWSSCFCVDPERSRSTRRAFLQRYEGTPVLILPAHFPTPTAGTIKRAEAAWQFVFAEP
ncbi:MAG TPA: MBL fold metallo-hydrolase [Candidatus Methylomirabilis sp.]|nr:MBL fold metallo-hydrolase [Candidatus Methylomirabilis sp.]